MSTSVEYSVDHDEFIIELFSEDDHSSPEKIIHNFDELITFFESLDQEKTRNFTNKQVKLVRK